MEKITLRLDIDSINEDSDVRKFMTDCVMEFAISHPAEVSHNLKGYSTSDLVLLYVQVQAKRWFCARDEINKGDKKEAKTRLEVEAEEDAEYKAKTKFFSRGEVETKSGLVLKLGAVTKLIVKEITRRWYKIDKYDIFFLISGTRGGDYLEMFELMKDIFMTQDFSHSCQDEKQQLGLEDFLVSLMHHFNKDKGPLRDTDFKQLIDLLHFECLTKVGYKAILNLPVCKQLRGSDEEFNKRIIEAGKECFLRTNPKRSKRLGKCGLYGIYFNDIKVGDELDAYDDDEEDWDIYMVTEKTDNGIMLRYCGQAECFLKLTKEKCHDMIAKKGTKTNGIKHCVVNGSKCGCTNCLKKS